jgi:hypothetical protein
MLGSNQRPPPCKGEKRCFWSLQTLANPAYLGHFLFYALPVVSGCCALGDVQVM